MHSQSHAVARVLPPEHHAARGGERHEAGCAEFHGLFDQPVHLVAARNALGEREPVRRFDFDIANSRILPCDRAAFDGGEFGASYSPPSTVEKHLMESPHPQAHGTGTC